MVRRAYRGGGGALAWASREAQTASGGGMRELALTRAALVPVSRLIARAGAAIRQ